MKQRVTKAVIAAAGFGTRFLPQTKAMPKEMLPLVDKPIIQYVVEELVEAGIKDIIIVGSSNKRAIEDHFDAPSQDLIANLKAGGPKKQPYIDQIEAIANLANFIYVRQKGPYGSATPVMNVAHLIGNEPFIYTFADDLIVAQPNRFKQMIGLYDELGGTILPCIEATEVEDFERYGIVDGESLRPGVIKMSKIVEKPGKAQAPSNFASVGGYLLTPEVFPSIEKGFEELNNSAEFYMTTCVLEPMIAAGRKLYGCTLKGSKYYDTGNKLEYLKTVVEFGLRRDDIGPEFRTFLQGVVQ